MDQKDMMMEIEDVDGSDVKRYSQAQRPNRKKLFDDWLENFKDQVNEIDDTKEIKLENDVLSKKSGLRLPMNDLINSCEGTFKFSKPSSITIGGSYALDTMIVDSSASIDVFVEMPSSVFQTKDMKNYRYMRKKAVYLCLIAKSIGKKLAESKSFIGYNWNPVLKIIPKGELGKDIAVHVHLIVESTTFKIKKFTPEKNNLRPDWYFNKNKEAFETNPATPIYNHIIMHDLTMKENLELIQKIKELPNIKDGILLLKIWLKQIQHCDSYDSFNSYVLTMYVLYLLDKNIINTVMSSNQMIKNTWTHLAKSSWYKDGMSICQNEKANERIILYKNYYDCVLLDSTGFCNVMANISENTANWISNQASLALDHSTKTNTDGFYKYFNQNSTFHLSFDVIICIHHTKALENVMNVKCSDMDKLNYDSNKYLHASKFITNCLSKGLKNRINCMTVFPRKMHEWNLNEKIPSDFDKLYIGIQLNPEFAFNITDKGPEANLPEAQEFRKYWGEKSELRRFQDTTIRETVVWLKENATINQRRTVPHKIIKFLLENKLKLFEKVHYLIIANQMDEFLKLKKIIVPKVPYCNEEISLRVIKTFDSLKNDLTELSNDLPLSISSVQGCSPVFCYTEVFPPQALYRRADEKNVIEDETHQKFTDNVDEVPIYFGPINAILTLSRSGKWPDDLNALRMTKAAFYVEIANCLRKRFEFRSLATMHHVDVMKDGLVFRLKIQIEKEINLAKRIVDKSGVVKYRDNEESIELDKNLVQLPTITSALNGLHCQQSSFGPACCLVKRWLSANLIDDSHMPDLMVELIMASIYLKPIIYGPTQNPQVAFFRFLEIFSSKRWMSDPIFVDFNNNISHEEMLEIDSNFHKNRESLPPLFISSIYDKTSAWTTKSPSHLIVNRITDLAEKTLELMKRQIFVTNTFYCQPLFTPSLSAYHCVIKLKDSLCARRFEAVNLNDETQKIFVLPFKENFDKKYKKKTIPIVDFDPVAKYLKELRSLYSDYALFFHDTYGGTVIGVLIKPNALEGKIVQVTKRRRKMTNEGEKSNFSVSAMLDHIYIIGKGLVETIDVQSNKIMEI